MMVQPVDVDTEPPGLGPFLAAAALVALAGFGLYLASGGLSESAPTTTADPPPTTTTTTTPTSTFVDAELRELVPGFQGRVRGISVFEDTGAEAWVWASGDVGQRSARLPGQPTGSWSGGLVAGIADFGTYRSLFFGPSTNVREVFNEVESFAWHSSEPQSLAFVTQPQSDGMRELWQSLPQPTTLEDGLFSASRVTRFEFDGTLVAYGDWGFALSVVSPSDDRPIQLVTLDPGGNFIAQGSFVFVDDFGDGRLLVISGGQAPNPQLAIVDISLGGAKPIGPEAAFGGVLSPNNEWVASVALDASGANLWLSSVDASASVIDPPPVALGVDVAFPVAWSPDGRWILATAHADAPASRGTQLVFADTNSIPARIHLVEVPGSVSGLNIDATGVEGRDRYRIRTPAP